MNTGCIVGCRVYLGNLWMLYALQATKKLLASPMLTVIVKSVTNQSATPRFSAQARGRRIVVLIATTQAPGGIPKRAAGVMWKSPSGQKKAPSLANQPEK